jgi:hypothetical protein
MVRRELMRCNGRAHISDWHETNVLGAAIFIAQALSQDHFAERNNMAWAAS